MRDTIFALSTSPGVSALAVIRISGPSAFSVLKKLIVGKIPTPRVATLKKVIWKGEVIDECIIICFNKGSSFTGEQVVELQTHGSQGIIKRISSIFIDNDCLDLRPAEEGEFTRQAFDNGKLDLTQVEGLGDLLRAETESQRKLSFDSYAGNLSRQINVWKEKLIIILADFEASIDFSDQDLKKTDILENIDDLMGLMKEQESMYEKVRMVKEGVEVAIIGPPNVGKSTLLNSLSGRNLALTSRIAGTTRDIIEAKLEIKGVPVCFLDTAGLHKTKDYLEKKGIALVRERIKGVLTRIVLIEKEDDLKNIGVKIESSDLIFKSKSDKGNKTKYNGISGKSGAGFDLLLKEIELLLPKINHLSAVIIGDRQKKKVNEVIGVLGLLKEGLKEDKDTEILAEECRRGVMCLEEMSGKIDPEEILGKIFENFCIGK